MDDQNKVFSYPVRVYYEDTDAGEIVYYANYLKFAERARTEALRYLGISQSELIDNGRIAFAVRSASADYRKPARLDDLLNVQTRLVSLKGASLEMAQDILRADELLVKVQVRIACIHLDRGAVAIPAEIRDKLKSILSIKE